MNRATTISFIYQKDLIRDKAVCNAIGVITFIVLTAIGAYVRIALAFTPVPITLQTFFVILAGCILGRRLGALSQAGYVVLGSLGLPIFTGAGFGLSYLAGPTGGYLIGFVVSAFLIGHLIELKQSIGWKILVFILGLASIYLCGIIQLSFVLNTTLYKSFLLGVIPFLPGAIIKLTLAILIYLHFGPRIKKTFLV